SSLTFEPSDAATGARTSIRIEAVLHSGRTVSVAMTPGGAAARRAGKPPTALFLPASGRADGLVASGEIAPPVIEQALERSRSAALALVSSFETWVEEQVRGLVVLIEEPELFLRPQAQRALYRLLHEFAALGNQVLYSTHAATFLNVARLEELALVECDAAGVTHIRRPRALPELAAFRALNEFDADRSELLLARAALLVEGRTEKLVFPFLFRALGYDADAEGISIVECGGKPNIPVIAEVCNVVGVPYVVVHDRDADPGRRPIASERAVNEAIRRVAGPRRTIELARDFEAVARLHGHRHKPERARAWFASIDSPDDVPVQLAAAVTQIVALARGGSAV
ncbi:MAG TPA: TOPRIM nucleotidyl transferase/hydrolase domain-containing protein, partial [Gaiellaceae bacterium]|nr:TOPRIM nucleotidyl transferase/hydrolase domain-containing protein [Gaiellaceae bacterium]